MNFIVRNQAQVANKYLRFAKWKIRRLNNKYGGLIYSEIFVKKITHSPDLYDITVKMGVPGPDIIVSARSGNLKQIWSELSTKMKRQLRKNGERRK